MSSSKSSEFSWLLDIKALVSLSFAEAVLSPKKDFFSSALSVLVVSEGFVGQGYLCPPCRDTIIFDRGPPSFTAVKTLKVQGPQEQVERNACQ